MRKKVQKFQPQVKAVKTDEMQMLFNKLVKHPENKIGSIRQKFGIIRNGEKIIGHSKDEEKTILKLRKEAKIFYDLNVDLFSSINWCRRIGQFN